MPRWYNVAVFRITAPEGRVACLLYSHMGPETETAISNSIDRVMEAVARTPPPSLMVRPGGVSRREIGRERLLGINSVGYLCEVRHDFSSCIVPSMVWWFNNRNILSSRILNIPGSRIALDSFASPIQPQFSSGLSVFLEVDDAKGQDCWWPRP
jgi:hypothetical protein